MTDLEKRAENFKRDRGWSNGRDLRADLLAEIDWVRENPPVDVVATGNAGPIFMSGWRRMADHIAACLGKKKE